MKQLVVLSGKGGVGKTSLVAAFAHLAANGSGEAKAVIVDADVDAANLELVLQPEILERHDFRGGQVAWIDPQLCLGCGDCYAICRFDAVTQGVAEPQEARKFNIYQIDPVACEGCAACFYQCPEGAIRLQDQVVGQWFRSSTPYGPLFHAHLRPAQENSGKLVTRVKQNARLMALDDGYNLVLVDGPPGIGCPVIAAASGADLALVVTEPTVAGVHDLQRILETVAHFKLKSLVCVNKADLHLESYKQIERYCVQQGVCLVGDIPFDQSIPEAMVKGQPVNAFAPRSPASQSILGIWERVQRELCEAGG